MFDAMKKYLKKSSKPAKGISKTINNLRNERDETAQEKQRRMMKKKKKKSMAYSSDSSTDKY